MAVKEPAEVVAVTKADANRTTGRRGFGPSERLNRVLGLFSPLLILALWELSVAVGLTDGRFFPPPSQIAVALWELTVSGQIFSDLAISLFRIFAGFFAGAIPGLVLGLSMGLFRPIRMLLRPIVSATYPIPKLALMPLVLVMFGLGETSKIITIGLGTFFMVLINTLAGVLNLDKIYLDVAQNFGASRKDYYLRVALPGALPLIFTGLELGMGMALLLIVAAEMNGADSGIGYLIWKSYAIYNMKEMFVSFILIATLGYVFAEAILSIQRKVVPWKQQ